MNVIEQIESLEKSQTQHVQKLGNLKNIKKQAEFKERYTLEELEAMPTSHQGQADNLKYEETNGKEKVRVWLSRLTVEDGMEYNNQVTVEEYTEANGWKWKTIDEYEAEGSKGVDASLNKKAERWVVFEANGKELLQITADDVFPGEIKETKELLAYEKKINVEDITTKIVEAKLNKKAENDLRSVKVSFEDGNVLSTNMASHLTDEEIKDYYEIGKEFNIGEGGNDKMSKVVGVEILASLNKKAEEGYQGYKNYETWSIASWIDNAQGTQDYVNEMALDVLGKGSDVVQEGEEGQMGSDANATFAKALKDWVEEQIPELQMPFNQILNGAIKEVDWFKLAENFLDDAKETGSTDQEQ